LIAQRSSQALSTASSLDPELQKLQAKYQPPLVDPKYAVLPPGAWKKPTVTVQTETEESSRKRSDL